MSLNLKLLKNLGSLGRLRNISTSCLCHKVDLSKWIMFRARYSTSSVTDNETNNDSTEELPENEEKQNTRERMFNREDISPENSKVLKVAIVGIPNAGKSTLINALTNYDVCPVSRRPHTTRKNQRAVYLDDKTQLVFVDTPGLVSMQEIKKFSFRPEFVYGPEKAFSTAHLIAVIHDVANVITRDKFDFRIKAALEKFPEKKSILILNKVDALKRKNELLEVLKYLTCGIVGGQPLPINTYEEKRKSHLPLDTEKILKNAKLKVKMRNMEAEIQSENVDCGKKADLVADRFFSKGEIKRDIHKLGWPHFHDVFMVSALEGDGIDLLRRYLIINSVSDYWFYEEDTLTDVQIDKLALQIIQAKLLDYLPQEMPFKIKPTIVHWGENEKGVLCIRFKLRCPREKYQWRIYGSGGTTLTRMTNEVREILCKILNREVIVVIDPVFDKMLAGMDN